MARRRKDQAESPTRIGGRSKAGDEDGENPRDRRTARLLPEYADPVDDALDDTFPASDPPSWSGLTLGRIETNAGDHQVTTANIARATIERMFAAFAAGDLDALIATVHEESQWTYHGANPRLASASFDGQIAVRKFFQRVMDRLELSEFNTDEFIVQDDTVVVFGSEAGTVRSTGLPFRNVWAQKYVVTEGRITEMVEYNIQVEPRN